MKRHRSSALLAVLVVGLSLGGSIGCASVAPGQDPIVVNAEKVLIASYPAYDSMITFAEQNKAKLTIATLKTFEAIRIDFPPAYRAFDSGVQTYKLATAKDPLKLGELQAEVKRILKAGCAAVTANGGQDFCGGVR